MAFLTTLGEHLSILGKSRSNFFSGDTPLKISSYAPAHPPTPVTKLVIELALRVQLTTIKYKITPPKYKIKPSKYQKSQNNNSKIKNNNAKIKNYF